MNDMWTFLGKKKYTQKHTQNREKKKEPTFIKKKEFIKIPNKWPMYFSCGKKISLYFFFRFAKKNTIIGFEWMNDQRSFPLKKNDNFDPNPVYFFETCDFSFGQSFERDQFFSALKPFLAVKAKIINKRSAWILVWLVPP